MTVAIRFLHQPTGETRTGTFSGRSWPEHKAIGVIWNGHEIAVHVDNVQAVEAA